ncbi:hypothetical protein J6590_007532 [Homalodisca vitripennis]|nr:hypothetical protein J6590_007532 [Homalodisca vitripennis]
MFHKTQVSRPSLFTRQSALGADKYTTTLNSPHPSASPSLNNYLSINWLGRDGPTKELSVSHYCKKEQNNQNPSTIYYPHAIIRTALPIPGAFNYNHSLQKTALETK